MQASQSRWTQSLTSAFRKTRRDVMKTATTSQPIFGRSRGARCRSWLPVRNWLAPGALLLQKASANQPSCSQGLWPDVGQFLSGLRLENCKLSLYIKQLRVRLLMHSEVEHLYECVLDSGALADSYVRPKCKRVVG